MDTIISARWADAAHTLIVAQDATGHSICIPLDPENRDYRRVIEGLPEEAGRPGVPPIPVQDHDASGATE
tara:strand:- start:1594 stop:1803 length:210 start_codon:yes stop_codon:yes gene_type:complete